MTSRTEVRRGRVSRLNPGKRPGRPSPRAAPAKAIRACILVSTTADPATSTPGPPNALTEVRGELRAHRDLPCPECISEHLPHMAKVMHKVAPSSGASNTTRIPMTCLDPYVYGSAQPTAGPRTVQPLPQFFP
jgi:hypothetical protein